MSVLTAAELNHSFGESAPLSVHEVVERELTLSCTESQMCTVGLGWIRLLLCG